MGRPLVMTRAEDFVCWAMGRALFVQCPERRVESRFTANNAGQPCAIMTGMGELIWPLRRTAQPQNFITTKGLIPVCVFGLLARVGMCRRSERRSELVMAASGVRPEKFTPDRDIGRRIARFR